MALIPMYVACPLALMKIGPLKDMTYGKMVKEYPLSFELTDAASFDYQVTQIKQFKDRKKTREWIADNCGPFPANNFPIRVTDFISSKIS